MEADSFNKYNFIIPAAGQGARLRPLTENTPKCMVTINEKSLLEHQLEQIPFERVRSLTFITGFEDQKLKDFVNNLNLPFPVRFFFNPLYCETHCAYSLLQAQNEISMGFIYINSDLLFCRKSLLALLDSKHPNALCHRTIEKYETDLQQLIIGDKQQVVDWDLPTQKRNNAELVGPIKISANAGQEILRFYNALTQEEQVKLPCYTLFSKLIHKSTYFGINITHNPWFEVDTIEDLEKAKNLWSEIKS
jgi:L-glutamine-phosphate cytidylyltransferase